MCESYETLALTWCARAIEVRYQANWLNSGYWHIELRCEERLLVTETGYRSHFVPTGAFSAEDEIRTYVLTWLDEAARDPMWVRYLEDSKQLKLF